MLELRTVRLVSMRAPAAERELLEEGIRLFPTFDKLYLMRAQLEERLGHTEAAKAAYQMGLRRCIHSTPLWTSLARLEERSGNLARARAFLEQVAATPVPSWCSASVKADLRTLS